MTQEVGDYVEHSQAECVIVVGDTLSAMAGALAGAYANVPVAHVEAGLRTHECEPWPEEMTRRAIGSVAHWHFTPTPSGFYNLLREGVDVMRIWNTGNPVVDSLHSLGVTRNKSPQPSVLVTLHRRENWPDIPVLSSLIASLADRHTDVQFTWPVHPNPAIEEEARAKCGYLDNIKLPDSLDYGEFMGHLAAAHLVITDSGGVQEEAAVLGVPTLVVRKNTERPEAVKAGVSRLIDSLGLFATADELLKDSAKLAAMEVTTDAFGDGRASERIADILLTGTTTLGEPN